MKTLYFGKWDNYSSDAPERQEAINEVLEAIDQEGSVEVSFDYIGRTRHKQAAIAMRKRLEETRNDLEFEIEYNYDFKIFKKGKKGVGQ